MLRQLAGEVVNTISEVDGVHNATSSAEAGVPQMRIQIDAEKAAQYGLTEQQIMGQVRLHFTGQVASQYREDGDEMDVTLMFPEEERSTISDLEDMKINSPSGATVPLASLADFKEVQGPVSLQRENQEPQVNVSGELGDRDLGSVTNDVKEKLDQMSLPEGYSYKVGGQAEDMAKSFSDWQSHSSFPSFWFMPSWRCSLKTSCSHSLSCFHCQQPSSAFLAACS